VFLTVDNLLLFILQHIGVQIIKIDNFLFRLIKRNLIEIRQVFPKMKYVDRRTERQRE